MRTIRVLTPRAAPARAQEFLHFYDEAEKFRDERAVARFRELANGATHIAKDAFWHLQLGLGMFEGLTIEQAIDKVNEQFPLADVDGSGALDEHEFLRCAGALPLHPCTQQHAHTRLTMIVSAVRMFPTLLLSATTA